MSTRVYTETVRLLLPHQHGQSGNWNSVLRELARRENERKAKELGDIACGTR